MQIDGYGAGIRWIGYVWEQNALVDPNASQYIIDAGLSMCSSAFNYILLLMSSHILFTISPPLSPTQLRSK